MEEERDLGAQILYDTRGQKFVFYKIGKPMWNGGRASVGLSTLPWREDFISYAIVQCLWRRKDHKEDEMEFPGYYRITREQFLSVKPQVFDTENSKTGKTPPLAVFPLSELKKVDRLPNTDPWVEKREYEEKFDPNLRQEIQDIMQKVREGRKINPEI